MQKRPTSPRPASALRLNQNPKAVRSQRFRKGLRQKDLAKAAGISTSHMCGIEAGAVSVGVEALSRLAKALGCKPEDLMAEELINQ